MEFSKLWCPDLREPWSHRFRPTPPQRSLDIVHDPRQYGDIPDRRPLWTTHLHAHRILRLCRFRHLPLCAYGPVPRNDEYTWSQCCSLLHLLLHLLVVFFHRRNTIRLPRGDLPEPSQITRCGTWTKFLLSCFRDHAGRSSCCP